MRRRRSRRWTLDAGRWTLDAGRWTLDAGRWTLDAGRWTLDAGRWTLDAGRWTLDAGRWTLDAGRWTLDAGRWTLDAGRWTLDAGRWTLDAGRWTLEKHDLAPAHVKLLAHFNYVNADLYSSSSRPLSRGPVPPGLKDWIPDRRQRVRNDGCLGSSGGAAADVRRQAHSPLRAGAQ
ncbi:hypothetical protein NCG89_07395 [Spongiibacter taiwanensis]|uniref:hypothetical protein n=1 Tax=Spongiibacter taiwanensis TaxID=1748242 RepID=UPI002035C76E|nr:hypothetical protein [Spongiibacter taiwanensis]USA44590.1 hypothetical protein NCG89_07395 [Spongiibacter taiwanensis]